MKDHDEKHGKGCQCSPTRQEFEALIAQHIVLLARMDAFEGKSHNFQKRIDAFNAANPVKL